MSSVENTWRHFDQVHVFHGGSARLWLHLATRGLVVLVRKLRVCFRIPESPGQLVEIHLSGRLAHRVSGVSADLEMPHGVVVGLLVLPHRRVSVAQRPASATFSDLNQILIVLSFLPLII